MEPTTTRSQAHLIRVLGELKRLDVDMPVAQALSLFIISDREGLSLKELAEHADLGMASASRYVAAFGAPSRRTPKGLGFVSATEDPMERRKKIIKLTPKGRAFVNRLLRGSNHANL